MTRAPHLPVAILGAGLTGLSTAEQLARRGVPCRTFERSSVVGGLASTAEELGYRFDRTGHLLHVRSESLRAEILDWLDGDCLTIERRSRVWSHGVYTRYPFQANTFGLPPQVAYECLSGFVEAFHHPPETPPSNFEEFCLAHFGAGISRHFMLPYNERLWGVAASEITPAWCARFVPLPRIEDVLAGAVGLNDRELGYNTQFLYPRRGIGALADALLQRAAPVEMQRAPRELRAAARELVFENETVGYGVLVSTIPLPVLLGLFDRLPPEVDRARGRLRATSLYYLDLALDKPAGKDFHWVYVPEEKYPFYRVGCYSHFSESMAPSGKANLYVELVDRAAPDPSTLVPRVLEGLIEMGVLGSAADVAFARVRHLDHAYVIYDHSHADALATIQAFLDSVNVISTGRYGGWNYSSMEDAILFGRAAAENAARRVK